MAQEKKKKPHLRDAVHESQTSAVQRVGDGLPDEEYVMSIEETGIPLAPPSPSLTFAI